MSQQSVDERIPPADIEAEAAVLSACMIDSASMKRVAPMLRPQDFYSEAHKAIYAACLSLYKQNEPVDIVQVATWLKDRDKLTVAGGMPYLTEVLNAVPVIGNVVNHAKGVRNKSRVRGLILECQKVVANGYAAHGDDLDFLRDSVSRLIEYGKISDKDPLTSNGDILREVLQEMERNGFKHIDVTGLRTGLDTYDRKTLGQQPGKLTIIGARPGTGKSGRLIQIANTVAESGVSVLMFSLEMGRRELIVRQLAMRAKIDAQKLTKGALSKEEWARVTEESAKIDKLPFWIDDNSAHTRHSIRERTLGAIDVAAATGKPLGLVLVDFLQRVCKAADDSDSEATFLGDVTKSLKELSKETGIPVVAAAALKRIEEGRPGRRPIMDDLRGSSVIESEADVIDLIHRPQVYDHDADPHEAYIIVHKCRHGKPGTIPVRFVPELTTFEDLPEDPKDWG